MTEQQFDNWLRSDARRITLVEIDTDVPRYLSSVGYATLPTDATPNRLYQPVVEGGLAFSESLSLDGSPSISVGDIEINNTDGALDGWLDDVWANRAVRVYIGDPDWLLADFRLIFAGVVSDLASSSPDRLNIVLRDKLERLNTPVTEQTLGGNTSNADRLLPVGLGEYHNAEPLLTDPAQHEYQLHQGGIERIIEVRDNGMPVPIVSDLPNGKFRLTRTPEGTVTASAQGRTPYANTVAALVQVLATQYGEPTERLTAADLDAASLAAFGAAHAQPVGTYLADRANVLEICQQLAASVGAQVVTSRTGLLRLVKVALPGIGSPLAIHPHDYEMGSLKIKDRTEVIAGVKLGYCPAWLVQDNVDTGIPPEHKDLYAQEYMTVTSRNPAVAAQYRLHAEPEQIDTLLLRKEDAQAEAARRLSLWSVPRTVYSINGYAQLLTLELGQAVTLHGPRWGLQSGKTGAVIGLRLDWFAGRAAVDILI